MAADSDDADAGGRRRRASVSVADPPATKLQRTGSPAAAPPSPTMQRRGSLRLAGGEEPDARALPPLLPTPDANGGGPPRPPELKDEPPGVGLDAVAPLAPAHALAPAAPKPNGTARRGTGRPRGRPRKYPRPGEVTDGGHAALREAQAAQAAQAAEPPVGVVTRARGTRGRGARGRVSPAATAAARGRGARGGRGGSLLRAATSAAGTAASRLAARAANAEALSGVGLAVSERVRSGTRPPLSGGGWGWRAQPY